MTMQAPPTQNRAPIDIAIALKRLNDDRAMLGALAGFFLEDAPNLMRQFHDAIREESLPQIVHTAHSLRGLAASFEAAPLMELTMAIEQQGKKGVTSGLQELARELDAEFLRLRTAVQSLNMNGFMTVPATQ